MPKKYPKSEILTAPSVDGNSSYVLFSDNDDGRQQAMEALSGNIESYTGKVHGSRSSMLGFDPSGVGGNGISGRYGLTTEGYEAWRPAEKSRFGDVKARILASDLCYSKHGLIRNIIDLMSDFGSQGIRLAHPNKKIEKFYQNWFRKVKGPERSERFLSCFYKLGQTAVRWQTAKINAKTEERLYKTSASPDMKVEQIKVNKREIPWKYVYLHPVTLEVMGGPLANFVGNPTYAIHLPQNLVRIIKSPRNAEEKKIVKELPDEIKAAAETHRAIPLPPDKTRVYYYKKDDWQEWADPMISSILIDISLYEKLKLADRAALDGAISNIRIFKLGSLEHKIIPGELAAQKLASILESNVEAGTLDLIWGPDIELIESKTSVHQFLGKEKYEPTLIAIYAGLGIPPTLTGTFGAAGTTNNFISLKTLTQRLEYGRDVLVQFWGEQLRIVQEAMGFRFPAKIEFDLMNLGDEASEKALLIQLADRSLISDEMVQRHFNHDPEMERIRINRETNDRKKGRMTPKAGAFNDPMFEEALKKIFAQGGTITPSELGIDLKPKKKGEKPALQMRQPTGATTTKKATTKTKTKKTGGRPKNSGDTSNRKTKTFKPKTKATMEIWAYSAQETIADLLNSILLEKFGKGNMRSLSSQEVEQVESIKFGVLCNLAPLSDVSDAAIYAALEHGIPGDIADSYETWHSEISDGLSRKLSLDERKRIQAAVYAEYKGE